MLIDKERNTNLKLSLKFSFRFISQMRNFSCLTLRRCFMTIAVLGCNHLRDFINYSYFMTPCQFPCLRKKENMMWKELEKFMEWSESMEFFYTHCIKFIYTSLINFMLLKASKREKKMVCIKKL